MATYQIVFDLSDQEKLCSTSKQIASNFLTTYRRNNRIQDKVDNLLEKFNSERKTDLQLKDIVDIHSCKAENDDKILLLKDFMKTNFSAFELGFILSDTEIASIEGSIGSTINNVANIIGEEGEEKENEGEEFLNAVKQFLLEINGNIEEIIGGKPYTNLDKKKKEFKKEIHIEKVKERPLTDIAKDMKKIDLRLSKELKVLEGKIIPIISTLDKTQVITFLKNLEYEIRSNPKFNSIIGKGGINAVIKNAITFGKNLGISGENKIYLNLYDTNNAATTTRLQLKTIKLIAQFIVKNNLDIHKLFGEINNPNNSEESPETTNKATEKSPKTTNDTSPSTSTGYTKKTSGTLEPRKYTGDENRGTVPNFTKKTGYSE